jgi:hypothetical protein
MGSAVQFPAEVTGPASGNEELDQACETDPLTSGQEEPGSGVSGQAEPLQQCPSQVRGTFFHLLALLSKRELGFNIQPFCW